MLKNKLLALLTLGIVLPVSCVSVYSVTLSTQTLINLVSKQMNSEAENSAQSIDTVLKNVQSDVLYLSKTPPVQGLVRARENKGIDPRDNSQYAAWAERMTIIFLSFLEARPYYYQLRYLDENGNELVRVDNKKGKIEVTTQEKLQNKSSSDYFKETMQLKEGDIYTSPINLNRENNQIEIPNTGVIRYATPIYNEQDKKRGIIIANILTDPLFKIATNEQLRQELQQQLIVVNQQGYYLYHPNESKPWGFEFNREEMLKNDYPITSVNQILSGHDGLIDKKTEYLLSYHTVFPNSQNSLNPFVLIYQTPKRVILKPVFFFRNIAIVVTFFSLGVTLALGTKVLQQLMNSISDLMNVISAFSEQILSTVNEQKQMATQQSHSVHETTVTVEELSMSSKLSAQQAEAALTTAKEVLTQVNAGNEAVCQTIAQMEKLKKKVETMAVEVLYLKEQTQQIGSVSILVADLANQTNMLALNAAVEAVRAGEQGKGFAVVAKEIRKLADESRQSGQKINNLVDEIQKAIQKTVVVTEEGSQNVVKGVQIAQGTSQVFDRITSAMKTVVENSQQIALNSQQQAIAIEQVTDAMNYITQGTVETAQGVSQTKLGVEQLSQATLKLKAVL